MKARSHSVIVEHVLVSFSPDINAELCKVEGINSFEGYSILRVKWIKPPH